MKREFSYNPSIHKAECTAVQKSDSVGRKQNLKFE